MQVLHGAVPLGQPAGQMRHLEDVWSQVGVRGQDVTCGHGTFARSGQIVWIIPALAQKFARQEVQPAFYIYKKRYIK